MCRLLLLLLLLSFSIKVLLLKLFSYNNLVIKKRLNNKLYMNTNNDDNMNNNSTYVIRILNSISEVSREAWNDLVGNEYYCPFLLYDWLYTLEDSYCASTKKGWQPLHLIIQYNNSNSDYNIDSNGTILAALPLYAKYHSYGEFIFDQSWANFAETQLQLQYYPKVIK